LKARPLVVQEAASAPELSSTSMRKEN
jgi:hypothetical protein